MIVAQSSTTSSNAALAKLSESEVKACSSADITACVKTCTPEQLAQCMKQCKKAGAAKNSSAELGTKLVAYSPAISVGGSSNIEAKTQCSLKSSCCKKPGSQTKVMKL